MQLVNDATEGSLDDQVTVRFVAFAGYRLTVRLRVLPTFMVRDGLLIIRLLTGMRLLTVMKQVSLFPLPSFAVAVMVTVPVLCAMTRPLLGLTVATPGLLEVQHTERLLAFPGNTDAVA